MAPVQLTIDEIAEVIEHLPVEKQQQLLERFRFSESRETELKGLVNRPQKKEDLATDRYGNIDLSEYGGQIEPEQLELLKVFMGAYQASEDFDPTRIFHPLDD